MAIGSDNQAALKAFHSNLRKPGHHLERETLRMANKAQKQRGAKRELTLRWTAGHEGNEAADTEVKKAAKGLTSDKQSLPCILRKALPKNPVALRQRHDDKLKQTWTTEWRSTKRRQGRKLMKTDESTPSTSLISSNHLTPNSASLISQLLVSHIPLNAYLHRFKRVDSDLCPACGVESEEVSHFLLDCQTYAHAHEIWALVRAVTKKRAQFSLETIFGESDLGGASGQLHRGNTQVQI